jgi:hypothetical protein
LLCMVRVTSRIVKAPLGRVRDGLPKTLRFARDLHHTQ